MERGVRNYSDCPIKSGLQKVIMEAPTVIGNSIIKHFASGDLVNHPLVLTSRGKIVAVVGHIPLQELSAPFQIGLSFFDETGQTLIVRE